MERVPMPKGIKTPRRQWMEEAWKITPLLICCKVEVDPNDIHVCPNGQKIRQRLHSLESSRLRCLWQHRRGVCREVAVHKRLFDWG
jgi:hypothetical protein